MKGKLTYVVAAATGIWAAVGFFLGQLEPEQAGMLILASLGTFGVRRAIGK